MDVATIASAALALLAPYLAKGAEEFSKTAGKAAFERAQALMGLLKRKFSSSSEASDGLEKFAEKPERYRPVVEDILVETLNRDPQFGAEIELLLKAAGPDLSVVQNVQQAERVTGVEADRVTGGSIAVNQTAKSVKEATGAKIGEFGKRE